MGREAVRRVLVGFDGFVDTLYRVVRDHAGGRSNPYGDIASFGREVASRAGLSGGFELRRMEMRAGGNAPLMAWGLSALGLSTTCVGALGLPPHPVFAPLARGGCALVPAAEPASTTALEFDDGKIMLGDMGPLEGLDWGALVLAVGQARLRALAQDSELVALLGWANMPHATALWRGLLETCLRGPDARPRRFFVDLADISRAGPPEVADLAALLRDYRALGEVALGLNENEARRLGDLYGLPRARTGLKGLERLAGRLRGALGLDWVVVHPRQGACVAGALGSLSVPGDLVERPSLSTGGGDHFNAGFCSAWLDGLGMREAATRAVRASGFYVAHGRSPTRADLAAELSP